MDYETLDKIADSYIPFLAIIFLAGLAGRAIKSPGERHRLTRVFIFFVSLLSASYGMMFLDNAFRAWPFIGLDYSTHTAVSLTLALSIGALSRQARYVVMASFFVYLLLMLYQKYHTVSDIVSTIAPLVLMAFLLQKLLLSQAKHDNSHHSPT